MNKTLSYAFAIVAIAIAASPVAAKEKSRPGDPPKPTCARASYPGDPVCDVDERGLLPTPSSQGPQAGGRTSAVRVDDNISVGGKSDFNSNRYGGAAFNNPSPNPHAQDVNGGGAVNYKF